MVKQDSVLGSKLKWFNTMKAVTASQQVEMDALSKQKQYTEKELYGDFRLPNTKW